MSESGTGRKQRSPGEDKRRAEAAKSFLSSIVCVVGYLLGVNKLGSETIVVFIAALFSGLAASQGLFPGLDGQRPHPPRP